jgi:hypothetical protein
MTTSWFYMNSSHAVYLHFAAADQQIQRDFAKQVTADAGG